MKQQISSKHVLLIANKYLFCDTNLLVTKVFSEVYYNYCDPLLREDCLDIKDKTNYDDFENNFY